MRVYVRDGAGEEFVISLPVGATLSDFKFQIFEATGVFPRYFKLFFNGENLNNLINDFNYLRLSGIEDGSIVQIMIADDMDEIENLEKAIKLKSVKALKAIIERGNIPNCGASAKENERLLIWHELGRLDEHLIGTIANMDNVNFVELMHSDYRFRTVDQTKSEQEYCMAGIDPSFANMPCNKNLTILDPPPSLVSRSHITPDVFVESGGTVRSDWEKKHHEVCKPYERNTEWIEYLHSLGL